MTPQDQEKQKKMYDWYMNLPARLQPQIRESLMDKAKISKSTFYNYVMGRQIIPQYIYDNCIVKFINTLNLKKYEKAGTKAVEN